jgi:hypothetical protein
MNKLLRNLYKVINKCKFNNQSTQILDLKLPRLELIYR